MMLVGLGYQSASVACFLSCFAALGESAIGVAPFETVLLRLFLISIGGQLG